MEVTRTAFGTWSGGRFMHFGEPLDDARFFQLIRLAYREGIRTFMTADVYGNGQADQLLAEGLKDFPRDSYCLVGAVGHDFVKGKREGAKGYPRFTDPNLRSPAEFGSYIRTATEQSLQRCRTSYFDLLLLHNPDYLGYTSPEVWEGLHALKQAGLAKQIGIAPGPANGFTLDLLQCFERFSQFIDWAMIILNPLEPWPGSLVLPAAEKHGIDILTRVVDYGGLFHDDVRPGHSFRKEDHRVFRPAGWVEAGCAKMEQMRDIARKHNLTLLQLACIWNLSQSPVKSVIPTLIQEAHADAKKIEDKVQELAKLPQTQLSREEVETIRQIGENKGCMSLKGANVGYSGERMADYWGLTPELEEVARRWKIDPAADLVYSHGAQPARK